MGSRNKVSNLVVLKLIEFLHCKQPIWVSLVFKDVLGLNMWNKSKMATNIMEFRASNYPFWYITYDEVLRMMRSNLQSFRSGCVGSTSTSSPSWSSFGFSCIGESFKVIFSLSSLKKLISTTFFTKTSDFLNLTCIDSLIVKVDLLKTLYALLVFEYPKNIASKALYQIFLNYL